MPNCAPTARNVGLPDGQMGNSEVGHLLASSAPAASYQDAEDQLRLRRQLDHAEPRGEGRVRIRKERRERAFHGSGVGRRLLVAGAPLRSATSPPSTRSKIPTFITRRLRRGRPRHRPRSARDSSPTSRSTWPHRRAGWHTVIGRYYYGRDDKRWERSLFAYDALVNGVGEHSSDMVEAVQKSTDEA